MRAGLFAVAAATGALVLVDPRLASLSAVVAVVALVAPSPADRAGTAPVPPVEEIVRVTAAAALLAVTVLAGSGGARVSAVAVTAIAGALLVLAVAVQPPGTRLPSATGAATVATVAVAGIVAARGSLPSGLSEALPALAAAGLAGVAAVRWGAAPRDAGRTVLVAACALAAAGTALPVVGLGDGRPVGTMLMAAGVVLVAGSVGPFGRALVRTTAVRTRGATALDERGGWTLAALVLAAPIVLVAGAGGRGLLPVASLLVLVPTLPAAVHLAVLARARRIRAAAASHDALTGLPSEPVFADALADALARAQRDAGRAAVAFLDLDGFKAINDRHGHEAGDALLVEVARRLGSGVRDGDLVARRSGDEFLVLLPDVTDRMVVEQVARRLARAVASPVAVGEAHLEVRASVGLAMWPHDAGSAGDLLAAADAAMYAAKAAGVDEAVRWCSAAATARARVAGRLRHDLEAMVARGDVRILLEPVIRLADGAVVAMHAVSRLDHPRLGELTPATYLPLMVDPTVARRYDDVVLRSALAAADRSKGELVVPCTAATLLDETWPAWLAARLADDGRPARSLQVAVSVEAVRGAGARLLRATNRLADLGVGVIVTDVGDGAELALRDLATLPLVGLEVSGALATAHRRHTDGRVLTALTALADAWEVPVRAVGSPDPEVLARLREHGVLVARGVAPQVVTAAASMTAPARAAAPRAVSQRDRVAGHGRDLDAVARALLEGRVEVRGDDVEAVLARVLQGEALAA